MRLRQLVPVLTTAMLGATAPPAAAACPASDRPPTRASVDDAAAAVECEINQVRRARDLPRLDVHPRLRNASARHARDMVRRGYFSHVGLDGRTMTARLRDAGYVRAGRRWAAGEVLAWGTFGRATPRRAVLNWMDSPAHRRVLLNPRYRDVGVGAAPGTPLRGRAPGTTYAAALGDVGR